MKPFVLKVLASAALLTLAACAVQPETHADLKQSVQTVAPAAWNVDAPQDSVNADAWWTQFGDPVMHQLVDAVLTGNLDVQAAVERVKQAQDIATQNRMRARMQRTPGRIRRHRSAMCVRPASA
jgi:outer membrane protein TolC